MARVELYIENKLCDLPTDAADIAIDYAVARIGELSGRKGVRSAEFELPKTATNRAIFENPDDFNNLTTRPYRRLHARLYVDGVDVGILTASVAKSKEAYNINLYGLNVDFFTTIKGIKVNQLDYLADDHYRNDNVAYASRGNVAEYVYPLIDYTDTDKALDGVHITSTSVNVYSLFPALFYNDIISKIVTEIAGYTLNIPDPLPYVPVLPFSNTGGGFKRSQDKFGRWNVQLSKSSPQTILTIGSAIPITFDTVDTAYNLNYQFQYWPDAIADQQTPCFPDEVTIDIDVEVEVTNPDPVLPMLLIMRIIGSVGVGYSEVLNVPAASTVTWAHVGTYSIKHTDAGSEKGSARIYVALENTGILIPTVEAGGRFTVTNAVVDEPGPVRSQDVNPEDECMKWVTLNSVIDEESDLSDWLKEYCKLFGYFIDVDEKHKIVNFFKFKEVHDNINSAVDWSQKLDLTKEPEISFALSDTFELNRFEYLVDANDRKPLGTDAIIDSDNETLKKSDVLVGSDFACTVSLPRILENIVPNIKALEPLEFTTTYTNQCTQRILILEREEFEVEYFKWVGVVFDSLATVDFDIPMVRFIRTDKTQNLGWDNSLLTDNYRYLVDVFNRTRVVRAYFRLTPSDLNRLDFKKPVYVDYFKSYFYISIIEEYAPASDESTLVELVKLY